jgi:DnaK suppressor protein
MTVHSTPARTDLDLDGIRLDLEIVETTRARQLEALAPSPVDVVASLHRDSVERLLEEIRAARRRLEDGSYGFCTGCREPIPAPRLELRPWAATCTRCSQR